MAERAQTQRDQDQAPERIFGQFPDTSSAELAAITVLKHGFAVQMIDSTSVAVQPGSARRDADEIAGMLAAYGARHSRGAAAPDHGPADEPPLAAVRPELSTNLELVEEELQPFTRTVVAGEVVIRKQVIHETVTIEVPVEREELVVERRPGDGSASERDARSTDPLIQALSDRLRRMAPGESLRIPLVEEEVAVRTQPVVRSEVIVGKRLVRDMQEFSGTVRREVTKVNRTGDVRVAGEEGER